MGIGSMSGDRISVGRSVTVTNAPISVRVLLASSDRCRCVLERATLLAILQTMVRSMILGVEKVDYPDG